MSDKAGKESQYIVSRPELDSDPPFGSDRESGCDRLILNGSPGDPGDSSQGPLTSNTPFASVLGESGSPLTT